MYDAVAESALVEALGLTGALLTVGTLYLAFTALPMLVPAWREMDARPHDASATSRPACSPPASEPVLAP